MKQDMMVLMNQETGLYQCIVTEGVGSKVFSVFLLFHPLRYLIKTLQQTSPPRTLVNLSVLHRVL